MPKILTILVDKINPEPTIEEMKAFGVRFDRISWNKLTGNKEFMKVFPKNLKLAEKLVNNILNN
jgi:hypothetical protein